MTQVHAAHARQFERLANGPLDLATLPDAMLEALAQVVPFERFCWGAVDPASLLPTVSAGTTIACSTPLIWEVQELVARGVVPRDIRSLARSLEHQLRAALVVDGTQWGLLHIERRHPAFTPGEVSLVDAVVPHFGRAFRRWILVDPNHDPSAATPAIPGVIVLDQDNEVDSISLEAEHWLSEWGSADLKIPPAAIAAVVGAARARAHSGDNQITPSARVRLPTGTWLQVRATHLTRPGRTPRAAIVLERATLEQVAPLIARAHQLSQRETEIALLVLRGLNTSEIAGKLFISEYTVQDHLKSIFEKAGVRSRRALATEVFEPHLAAA
jgi:DNA-binding CsgD family transcriptional regulator